DGIRAFHVTGVQTCALPIFRSFVGKENRPLEVMCWTDTLVHPIEAEDHAIALIRFESGAVGQVETSWAFRGGMDLRDEVAGTEEIGRASCRDTVQRSAARRR